MATPPIGSSLVSWVYASDDERSGRELVRLAGVLARQGLLRNRPLNTAGLAEALLTERHVVEGEIAVFLASPAALADSHWQHALRDALRESGPRVVVVVVRAIEIEALPPDARRIVLPRDGTALAVRKDRDEAMLEVIGAVQELATFRQSPAVPAAVRPTEGALSINHIFRLNGLPTVTFVEPPQFRELKLELATMGTGLILEGPSKTGKSTAVRKAMEELEVPASAQTWWQGQRPPPFEEFQTRLDALVAGARDEWFFIDDFHYLEDARYRSALAFASKALADQPSPRAKITLIGINPLGQALLQTMPDLSGRFRIMHLHRDPNWDRSSRIAELIVLGERAANVRFTRRDEFVVAARGSFFIAQFLCNKAAQQAGVFETQPRTIDITLGPVDVIASIRDEMAGRYQAPLLQLAACDATARPRGAGLALLWLLARSPTGFVAVREAELRFPRLKPVFDWFLQSNLSKCFDDHPQLRGILYFNRATGTLTMEDPQLEFYLRNLDWREFAEASGHGIVQFHPDDGPMLPEVTGTASFTLGPATLHATARIDPQVRRVLHLSDLHFGSSDQATIAYSQLRDDLQEQGVRALDAAVISGDLVNYATPAEYEVARSFLEQLMSGFSLKPQALVLVPGNHDVSWTLSKSAYDLKRRSELRDVPAAGTFIEHGSEILEVRDDERYRRRFAPFAEMYEKVKGVPYPLAYDEQAVVTALPDAGLTILGLNSSWEIDHSFKDRASVHAGALSRALLQLTPPAAGELRIATFHHPLQSDEEARLRDNGFMQRLAVAGFELVLHGHVHRADNALYRYDRSVDGRRLEIVTAGTFGAPVREWRAGYPLQYNLLDVGAREVTVRTRARAEVNGAWTPDARWLQGPGQNPLPYYVIPRR